MAFQYMKGAYNKDRERIFRRASSDRRRGDDYKLKEGKFGLDTRKKLSMMKVVGLDQVAQRSCG